MKSLKYLALCLVAALVTTSCSNDENEPQAPARKGKAVKFEMSIAGVNTRTTTDASTRTTDWKVGDAVGIFVYEEGSLVYTNAKYQYDGTDWKCESNGIIVESGKNYKYYAYYPYQDGIATPTSVALAAAQDQNSGDGYNLSDILAASNENGATNAENSLVTLTFKHMYAMVEVSLFGDKVTQDPSAVKLLNVKLGGTLNLETQSVTNSGELTEVTMKYLGLQKEARAYRAVVPAQSITTNTPLVAVYDIDAAGKDYQFTYSKDVPYEQGKYRIMEVKIGEANSGITIPSKNTTIDPWTPSTSLDGTGSYEEIVVKLIKPIGDTFANNNQYIATPATEEGWYMFATAAEQTRATFSIETDNATDWGKSMKLTYDGSATSANNSWYKSAISYITGELPQSESHAFKLTAKIKSSSTTEPIVFTIRDKANNNSFVCHSSEATFLRHRNLDYNGSTTEAIATTSSSTPGNTDWKTDYTLYIDMNHMAAPGSYKSNAVSSIIDNTDFSQMEIRIYTNLNKSPYLYSIEVSDVVLEPYSIPVP